MDGSITVSRRNWQDVVRCFGELFAGIGGVTCDSDQAEFSAADTGLSLRRDGTSQSFMPLHRLGARWDEAVFDFDASEVRLRADGVDYVYRVPRQLLIRSSRVGDRGR